MTGSDKPEEQPMTPLPSPVGRPGFGSSAPAPMLAPKIARLQEELSQVKKSLRSQRAETLVERRNSEQLRQEVAQLRARLESGGQDDSEGGGDLGRVRAEYAEQLEQQRAWYEARLSEVEARCAREIAELEEKQATRVRALRDGLRTSEEILLAKSGRIRRLEARLVAMADRGQEGQGQSLEWASRLGDRADDLTALPGIGPAYARALHGAGIRTFSQIAMWSEEDIERIAPRIGTTAGRILRDDWVGEARKIVEG